MRGEVGIRNRWCRSWRTRRLAFGALLLAVAAMAAAPRVARAQETGAVADSAAGSAAAPQTWSLSGGPVVLHRVLGDDLFFSSWGVSAGLHWSPESALHLSLQSPLAVSLRYQRVLYNLGGVGVFAHAGATGPRLVLAEMGLGVEWLFHDRAGVSADLGVGAVQQGCCIYSTSLSLQSRLGGPGGLRLSHSVPDSDAITANRGWFGFSYGLRFQAECVHQEWHCIVLPGASLQISLGSRLALQGSAHTLWAPENLGMVKLYSTRAKVYLRGRPARERLFAYGMMALQPAPRANTFRSRTFGVGWEWMSSARTTSSVDIGLSQSTHFIAMYRLVIGAEIHMHRGM